MLNFISLNFGRDSGRCRSFSTILFCARCNFSFGLDVLGIFELICLLTQCWWRLRDLHGWFGSFFEMLRMAILTPKKPCLVGQGGDYIYAMFNVTVTPLLRKYKFGDRRYALAFMIT